MINLRESMEIWCLLVFSKTTVLALALYPPGVTAGRPILMGMLLLMPHIGILFTAADAAKVFCITSSI